MAKQVSKRSCTPDDKRLGAKIRARRTLANVSQTDLGTAIGVSFQQVQKYENGTNRVSAVRLEQIANALEERITFFQTDNGRSSEATHELQGYLGDALTLRACRALSAIENGSMRHQLVRLIERLSGHRHAE